MQRRVVSWAVLAFVAASAAVLAGVADSGLLCDDAFYYFQIARNAVRGHGFSFDGVAPTNGFHPLWGWLCALIWRVAGDRPWPPVYAALVVLAGAGAATAIVLYRIGRALGDEQSGATMAALWLLSPFAVLLPLRGCEGAWSALLLALATWAAVALDAAPSSRAAALLGLAVGGAGLARTENVLFGAAALVFVAWRTRSWRAVALYGAVAAAVVAPWLAWSWLRVGTVVQVSGAVKRAIDLHGRMPPVGGPVGAVDNVRRALISTAGWIAGEEFHRKHVAGVLAGVMLATLAAAAFVGRRRATPRALVVLYVYAALHLAAYCWYFRAYYNWYFLPLALTAAVFVGERAAAQRAPFVVTSALACALALVSFFAHTPYRRHGLADTAIVAAAPALPPGARIGVLNAGAVGYFLGYARPDVTVVNLDCVVNNVAFAAWRAGAYDRYLLTQVDFVDAPPDARFLGAAAAAFARAHVVDAPTLPLYRLVP